MIMDFGISVENAIGLWDFLVTHDGETFRMKIGGQGLCNLKSFYRVRVGKNCKISDKKLLL